MDIASVTNTAQAIADMNINQTVTIVMVAFIAIVNVVALFLRKR